MTDLTEFLLTRIAEDEARVTIPDVTEPDGMRRSDPSFCHICGGNYWIDGPATRRGNLVGRVLAECEAKRRIVDHAQAFGDDFTEASGPSGIMFAAACLALPYAAHPDYRPEWRP